MTHLQAELTLHQALKAKILAEFPDLDEQTLADTLEGAGNLNEAIAAVVRSMADDEMMVEALVSRIQAMKERKERLEARQERMRELVAKAMDEAGLKKLVEPDFTLSLTATARAVIIADEARLPAQFVVQPPPPAPRPDKKAIKAAILEGQHVEGAFLSNAGVTITVRRK